MASIKLDVFGRKMLCVESENGWSVFDLGDEGKRRPATDIVVPRDITAAKIVQYLADLCHERASARHPQVTRLE